MKLKKSGKIPKPNVTFVTNGEEPDTDDKLRGILCNPVYVGVGPYPQIVPEKLWVQSAAKAIREDGPEQFLVNMLYVLKSTLGHIETVSEYGGGKAVTFWTEKDE